MSHTARTMSNSLPASRGPGRLGLLEPSEQFANAPNSDTCSAPCPSATARRTKEVGQHRDVVSRRVLEQQGQASSAQHAVAQCRHFKHRRDRFGHAPQLALTLQAGHEISQVAVFRLTQII